MCHPEASKDMLFEYWGWRAGGNRNEALENDGGNTGKNISEHQTLHHSTLYLEVATTATGNITATGPAL